MRLSALPALLPLFLLSCEDADRKAAPGAGTSVPAEAPASLHALMTDPLATAIQYEETVALTPTGASVRSLEELYARWDGSPQAFVLEPGRETEISAKSGTRFRFPPGLFQFADGREPQGNIRLEVKEFYSHSDFIKANLTTQSDGRMIESAGTVYVEAFSEGLPLTLKPGRSYQVMFARDTRNRMEIFYGTRDTRGLINWKVEAAASGDAATTSPAVSPAEEADFDAAAAGRNSLVAPGTCFLAINESKLLSGWRYNCEGYAWKLDENGQTLYNYFLSTFNPSVAMIDEFCILGLESQVVFSLDEKGRIRDWYLAKKTRPEYDSLITRFIRSIPTLDLGELAGGYATNNKCMISIGKSRIMTRDAMAAVFRAKQPKDPLKPVVASAREELDYYVLNASQLGWINCDQFIEATETVDFVVQNPRGSEATINLVFEDMNSILQGFNTGAEIVFKGVPAHRKVRVVGLSHSAGHALMAVSHTTTSDKPFALTDYKTFSLSALDEQLARLD
ncbi:MAG TPA: hypothetical protein DCE81_11360 [Cytophagales bacterium]|nr:hypothetical protein [Cytophagales bacterium]